MSEFKLGATNDIYSFLDLDELLPNADIPIDPDWSFQPFSAAVQLGDGTIEGTGFPIAIWRFNHITRQHRATLRAICPGLSANVFIRTATNELDAYDAPVFATFSAVMQWPPEDEDIQVSSILSFVLRFTHLDEVVE